jgi:outer membrane lipoprotein SlyB
VAEFGVCAAARAEVGGLNGGCLGGRVCWAIAGTLCGGKVQGIFAQKVANCMGCEFYLAVKREEGSQFKLMP